MMDIGAIREVWERQPDSFPVFLEANPEVFARVSGEEKKENEALIEEASRKMQERMQQRPETGELQELWERETELELKEFLKRERILSLLEWMSEKMLNEFERETKRFVGKVKGFDETLKPEQIWQAMRNYLIYAMIVEMQGEKQNAKDPILAYSLLYPYTDNYIDNGKVLREEKERYNRMIQKKLLGEKAAAENPLEEKTCRLLDMILDAYTGRAKAKVAGTLLSLLEAQSCSIGQLQTGMGEECVLEISVWKGGTSVLTDYLLAADDWMEEEEKFYLKFGFILQLVDDLQDIEEDGKAGSHTLMTDAAGYKQLQERVNRLLWFTWNVIGEFEPRKSRLKGFILKNCVSISLLAAVTNARFFSKEYIKALEPYLPVSGEFIKKMKKQKKKRYIEFYRSAVIK